MRMFKQPQECVMQKVFSPRKGECDIMGTTAIIQN